uniref:PiggyBac transposable element-derived protein domain-containing protein n=1 Tax=Oryzias latipes TaxID=8090 RepID=A0A3P9JWZ2_ORYLA
MDLVPIRKAPKVLQKMSDADYLVQQSLGDNLPKSDDIKSPYEHFTMFFSEDILEVVVEQSNLYAIQCNTNKPLNLTTNELERFMGTAVYMSLFGLPGTRMFWNKATLVSQVADTMALNRWEFTKKSLHFNNNEVRQGENVDPLHKIRPLVTHLTSKLQTIPMGEKLAVDEQMVPFKGRNRLKQFLPAKPKNGATRYLVVQPSELPDVGASGNVVLRLAQPIPKHQRHKLFFDNWFTSVPLILTLAQQGIHCHDAELKRTGRGSFDQKTAMVGETTLHVVKWYDNRSVSLLSDYIGAHPVTDVDRWDGKQKKVIRVPCPAVVREYNKNMGGVDLLDSLIALYRTKIRSKKWYHRSESLCKCGKNLEHKRGRPSSTIVGEYKEKRRRGPATPIPVPDVRLDATAHWMVMDEKKGRCKVPGCKGTPKAKCQKCDVHLCFTSTSKCFLRFHAE